MAEKLCSLKKKSGCKDAVIETKVVTLGDISFPSSTQSKTFNLPNDFTQLLGITAYQGSYGKDMYFILKGNEIDYKNHVVNRGYITDIVINEIAKTITISMSITNWYSGYPAHTIEIIYV